MAKKKVKIVPSKKTRKLPKGTEAMDIELQSDVTSWTDIFDDDDWMEKAKKIIEANKKEGI